LLSLNSVASDSQKLDTISLRFERKVVQRDYTEVVKGIAYYKAPQKVFIEVQDPVKQIMFVDGDVMLIYYPVEKKAFRIKAKGAIPMPFVQGILSVMKDDYGLTEMGYKLARHEKKGDTLYTYWDPPKDLEKNLGEFVLGTVDGVLVYAEARKTKKEATAKSFYSKHIEMSGKHFPMEVRSEIVDGSSLIEEFVSYSDVKFNIPLPDEATDFTIPDSIPVKEVEW
jgi:outer membrane lipoprotein-sorting protein